ncbi:DUF397 domain-containing protein [Streptomyces sp. NRRL S-1022]|uniref:DUF397 domain-containing protein n=1 Tax=Streptomyces sp. NRRL S-1022 TaxID=1463880 RepID=UPI00099D463D|nr:DUF397 domain-containing protein [Streptomyces sp. NRRL S-1022]
MGHLDRRKSSYSSAGDGNECAEVATSPTPTVATSPTHTVATSPTHTAVRGSKAPDRIAVTFPAPAFAGFLEALKTRHCRP